MVRSMSLFRPRPTDSLSINLFQDTLFLHPAHSSAPSDDPILRGTLSLFLASPRRINSLRVELRGTCTMHGGGDFRYEKEDTLVKTVTVDLGNQLIGKGEHLYQFSFIIPSTTAVTERSKFGTVRHVLKAYLDNAGPFGSTLSSPVKPVWLIASTCAPGEVPQGLETSVQDLGGELGPLAMHVSSGYLTVSSLLFVNIALLCPPALQIMSVQCYIAQSFTIQYNDPEKSLASPPPQRKILFYVDQTTPINDSSEDLSLIARGNVGKGASIPLAHESRRLNPKPWVELEAGKDWNYSRIVRVPDDDHVRPTTLEYTQTPIRVKHRLVVEVRYRRMNTGVKPRDMILEMSTDVTIASCCCLADSLLLPSYALSAPSTTPIRPFHRRCLCNSSFKDIITKDGPALERAESRPRRGSPEGDRRREESPKLGVEGGYTNDWNRGREELRGRRVMREETGGR